MPTPVVETNEVLYRQVGSGGNPVYCDRDRDPPILQAVFLPSPHDSDGLSLIRGKFRDKIWAAFRVERPTVRFTLVVLDAAVLNGLAEDIGFTDFNYSPTPDSLDISQGEPWAHCVAPAINRTQYDADEATRWLIKEWARQLADLIACSNLKGPFAAPTSSDPYRPPA